MHFLKQRPFITIKKTYTLLYFFFQLKDVKTPYNTTKKEVLAVIQCLAKVWKLIIEKIYLTKLYTDYSILKNIFTQESDIYGKIVYQIDTLTEYNYKIYHWSCKPNIIQMADGISDLLAKYKQYISIIDLEKIILMITFFQSWLSILFT